MFIIKSCRIARSASLEHAVLGAMPPTLRFARLSATSPGALAMGRARPDPAGSSNLPHVAVLCELVHNCQKKDSSPSRPLRCPTPSPHFSAIVEWGSAPARSPVQRNRLRVAAACRAFFVPLRVVPNRSRSQAPSTICATRALSVQLCCILCKDWARPSGPQGGVLQLAQNSTYGKP